MNSHYSGKIKAKNQRGVATLLVSIVLLLVATLTVFATGRSAINEQKLAANDVRTKEAYAAAIKGHQWAITWIGSNIPVSDGADCDATKWTSPTIDAGATGEICNGAKPGETDERMADTSQPELSDDYIHTITFEAVTDFDAPQPIIQVISTATAKNDSQITQTVSSLVERSPLGTASLSGGPPLIVEYGVSGVTGTPNIELADDPDPSDGIPEGMGIGTINGPISDVNPGFYEQCEMAAGSPEATGCNNGASPALTTDHVSLASGSTGSLWSTLFNFTESEFRTLSAANPNKYYWVDSSTGGTGGRYASNLSGPNWNTSVGSLNDPVILILDSSLGCTGFTGSHVIYGVVYFKDASSTCTSGGGWDPGWGNVTICGTVAIEGSITKFTANAGLLACDLEDDFEDPGASDALVTSIPGTWKDF